MISTKKKSAVIFDCDGVMFDSRKANINYYNSLLANFNLPPMNEKEINYVHSYTANDSIKYIFEGTPYLEQAIALAKKVDYTPFINDMVIEPGLKDLLKDLSPDFGLAVATNRSTTIGKVLQLHGLEGYFDIVVSSLDVKNPKPHPESLLKILDFFEINPKDAFYIGDSQIDHDCARAVGVIFVAYKSSMLKADYHVELMVEILEVIKGKKQIAE
jgi:phosphoglycolate phosphatase